jgi:hypothetical protein
MSEHYRYSSPSRRLKIRFGIDAPDAVEGFSEEVEHQQKIQGQCHIRSD